MTNVVLLDKEAHRSLIVDGRPSAALGDRRQFVPVIVKELTHLVVHCPILFSKDAQTGQFYCGALLGFEEGENLLLEAWESQEAYRPLHLQRGPFLASGPNLALDLDHPRVGAAGGERVFDEDGNPSRYLQSIMWVFQELKSGTEMSRLFIARLLELNLIEPIDIDTEFSDGTKRSCTGLYTINQSVLERLPDEAVVELFRRGYLRLINYMIISLKQVPVLASRRDARLLKATAGLAGTHGA